MFEAPDDQDPQTTPDAPDAIAEDDPERMVFPGPAEHPPTHRARPDAELVDPADAEDESQPDRSRFDDPM